MPTHTLLRSACAIALLLVGALRLAPGAETAGDGRYHPAWMQVSELSEAHYGDGVHQQLLTPQATMEFFLAAVEEEDFARASLALNLQGQDLEPGGAPAARLARRLYYLLLQRNLIDWDTLPDRSDGQPPISVPTGERTTAGQPRRSIQLGRVEGPERPHSIALRRIKPANRPAVWLFAASSVGAIDRLYHHHGPGWLEAHMPAWAKQRGPWQTHLWEWLAMIVFLGLAVLCGCLAFRLLAGLMRRAPEKRPWLGDLLSKLERPVAGLIGVLAFYTLVRASLSLTGPISSRIDLALVLVVIIAITWVATRVIQFATDRYAHDLQRQVEDGGDPRLSRTITAVSVLRRVLTFIAVALALGVILQELQLFRTIGIALLASAGAAGALFALASGAVLGNLIAGLQVAITRPVDIGDTVVVEGAYGWVEEITYTYLVVRTWERRRLIIPLRHFVQTPFENLTKTDTCLIRPVRLHVDYRVDVHQLRETFGRLVRDHEDYDGTIEPKLIVLEAGEDSLWIQGYVSTADPTSCWFMHCDIREAMNAHISKLEDGLHLPRERVQSMRSPGRERQSEHDGAGGEPTGRTDDTMGQDEQDAAVADG